MKKNTTDTGRGEKKITRKKAIEKVGIAALTAASIMFLSTKQSSAGSNLPDTPGDGW